jgi:hypothetical protein
VRVLETTDPVRVPGLGETVEVVGAPWPTKRPSGDLVAEVCAGLGPPAGLRVLVGHGAVDRLSPDPDSPQAIRLAALEQAVGEGLLHYVALGDRHSVTEVGSTGRVWYAGTPLVTDYDEVDPNQVLLVTLDDARVTVEPRRVGSWRFLRTRLDVDGEQGVDRLEAYLDGLPDKDTSVVELELVGTLGLGAKARLDDLLEHYGTLFASLRVAEHRSDLAVLPDEADLDELGLVGFAAATLEELRTQAASGQPGAETAADALGLLYRLVRGQHAGPHARGGERR